jgi:hypothetical protein
VLCAVHLSLLLSALVILFGCANPSPVDEADPVNLPALGMDAVRIFAEMGRLPL